MAISGPPKRKETAASTDNLKEEKIRVVINKGGKPTAHIEEKSGDEILKSINIKLTEQELIAIKHLRELRPKPGRNRKISISVHDWIVEAIQEKIERETKKYR